MNNLLSPLYQKILALLLLIVFLWLILNVLIAPFYVSISDKSDHIEMLENRVLSYQSVIGQKDDLEEKLLFVQNNPLPDPFYYGENDVDLSAQIQSDIRSLFSGAGARVENIQSISIANIDKVYTVGLRTSVQVDMASLIRILNQFRSHSKILDIDNISLRTQEQQSNTNPPQMTIRWDIYGFGMLNENGGGSE